jgi:hypothetical protein
MGFALGGGLLWSIYRPSQQQQVNSSASASTEQKPATSFRERLSVIWQRTWDDPVAFYTFALGIFSLMLVVVSGTQIIFLIRADKTARITAEAAKQSADTVVQVERPLLYLKNLEIEIGDTTEDGLAEVKATFAVANLGRTPAILLEYSYRICDGMPTPGGYLKAQSWHERVLYPREEITDIEVSGSVKPRIKFTRRNTHLVGYFYYADVFGVKRRAAFCYGNRDWRGHIRRGWERVGGDQYNYERIVNDNPNLVGEL